jgi:DNA (cytosine-5)-methyltransferase 3A
MNVLSLFDGISCARVALDRAGIEVNAYMSAEIDKNAIKVSEKNYPDIIRVGSVVGLEVEGQIDLLIGGSPCQDLSIAKKDRKGLEGNRSGLFWEYVRIKKECNPTWFVLENVASMPKADRDIITREMGVEPVMFNASLVSAQCRKRLFWTNIPFSLPANRGILLKDILEAEVDDKFYVKKGIQGMTATPNKKPGEFVQLEYFGAENQCKVGGTALRVYDPDAKAPTLASVGHMVKVGHIGNSNSQGNRVYDTDGKSCTLSALGGGLGAKTGLYKVGRDVGRRLVDGHRADADTSIPYERRIETREDDKCGTLTSVAKDNLVVGDRIRKLTPIECERLQGLPDNYTEGVAMTHRYKCLGNAFNVDVVAHILSGVKNE